MKKLLSFIALFVLTVAAASGQHADRLVYCPRQDERR